MRFLLFVLLAACELEPQPKQQPAQALPPGPPPAQQQAAPPAPTPRPAPADAGVAVNAADAAIQVKDDCVLVGVHLVDVMIKVSTDPAQKNALEQERATIVRKTAEVCTTQAWSDELRACWKNAQTSADLTACGKMLPGQQAQAPRKGDIAPVPNNRIEPTRAPDVPAGAGSAAVRPKRPEPGAVRPKRPQPKAP